MARLLNKRGYATLRLDMPGCGAREGERGRHVCLEQVAVANGSGLSWSWAEEAEQAQNRRFGDYPAPDGTRQTVFLETRMV